MTKSSKIKPFPKDLLEIIFRILALLILQIALIPHVGNALANFVPAPTVIEQFGIKVKAEKKQEILKGWKSIIESKDPGLIISAFKLLVSAPPNLKDLIINDVIETGSISRIYDFLSVRREDFEALLQDFPKFTNSLQSQIAKRLEGLSGSESELREITQLGFVLEGQTKLDSSLSKELIALYERSSNVQIKDVLSKVFREHPEEFLGHTVKFFEWLGTAPSSKNNYAPNSQQHLALSMLLKQMENLGEDWLLWAMKDPLGQSAQEVFNYLANSQKELIGNRDIRERLVEFLLEPPDGHALTGAYRALEKVWPKELREFVRQNFSVFRVMPPSISNDFISQLPKEFNQISAMWLLSFEESSGQKRRFSCEILQRDLIILNKRKDFNPIFNDFWKVSQGSYDCYGENLLLKEAVSFSFGSTDLQKAKLGKKLLQKYKSSLEAWGQFMSFIATYTPNSNELILALSPTLQYALQNRQFEQALELLKYGVRLNSKEIESSGFWKFFENQEFLEDETLLEILIEIGESPKRVKKNLEEIIQDKSQNAGTKSKSIEALAKVGNELSSFETLSAQLRGFDPQIAFSAIYGLVDLYRNEKVKGSLPILEPNLLAPLIEFQWPNDIARKLLVLLSQRENTFGELLYKSIKEKAASPACWDLSVLNAIPNNLWLGILDLSIREPRQADMARACILILTAGKETPKLISKYSTNHEGKLPSSYQGKVELIKAYAEIWDQAIVYPKLRGAIASHMQLLLPFLSYSFENRETLQSWIQALDADYPEISRRIKSELVKRDFLLSLFGIPIFVIAHISLWFVFLFVYPHSTFIQSVIFWNPKIRKIIGVGYMDFILLAWPWARGQIFLPFRERMLGEILQSNPSELDRVSYFSESWVRVLKMSNTIVANERPLYPISKALSSPKGRNLLLGGSGLGKSSFLRNHLVARSSNYSDLILYVSAHHCIDGVEKQILGLLKGFARNADLIRSLIHAGRLSVFIDGYNEVDLKTQESITSFLADYPNGNILVTSQIPLRGLSLIDTFELLPLSKEQIKEFLVGREAILPETASIKGASYQSIARLFLESIWSRENEAEEAELFDLVLSNPMDLTTVAIMLSKGKQPNLISLQEQQFNDLRAQHLKKYNAEFRVKEFSEEVFCARLEGKDDLTGTSFKREVASLVDEKMALIRTIEIKGVESVQEIRFRHDRIRDFILHYAFLDEKDDRREECAGDSRFSGVYEFLGKVLPPGPAKRLQEYLLIKAVDSEDHRLSDSFIKQLLWRQKFKSLDPEWIQAWDLPETMNAEKSLERLNEDRRDLEGELKSLQEVITARREKTRILVYSKEVNIVSTTIGILEDFDIFPVEGSDLDPEEALFSLGGDFKFSVFALGEREKIREFQVQLLLKQLQHRPRPILLITNSQISLPPNKRDPDLRSEDIEKLKENKIFPLPAVKLYSFYSSGINDPEKGPEAFCKNLEGVFIGKGQ